MHKENFYNISACTLHIYTHTHTHTHIHRHTHTHTHTSTHTHTHTHRYTHISTHAHTCMHPVHNTQHTPQSTNKHKIVIHAHCTYPQNCKERHSNNCSRPVPKKVIKMKKIIKNNEILVNLLSGI